MAFNSEFPQKLDLDKYDVHLEQPLNDTSYIFIDRLPDILTYGKHFGTLSWRSPNKSLQLKHGSKILFELKDKNGNIIKTDLSNTAPVNGAAIFYVWIEKDPKVFIGSQYELSDGPCKLTVVYELDNVPPQWKGKYNGRSTFQFELQKNLPNTSPILFYSSSLVSSSFSISESIDIDTGDTGSESNPIDKYERSILHISTSNLKTEGGKVDSIEVLYNESRENPQDFKLLTTYPISSSGEFYEITSSLADGLNPLSHIQKVVTPKDIRRNGDVTFKLRFLNSNQEVARKLLDNSEVAVSTSCGITGSPFLLETSDNLVHDSGGLFFGDKLSDGIKIKFDKGDLNQESRLVFEKFKAGSFEKEISRIDGTKAEYIFGDVTKNKIKDSSGSAIIGGTKNTLTSSISSSIISSTSGEMFSSSYGLIIGGRSNDMIHSTESAIISSPASDISESHYSTILGGRLHDIHHAYIGTVVGGWDNDIEEIFPHNFSLRSYNTLVGGKENKIRRPGAGSGATSYGNTVIGGTNNEIIERDVGSGLLNTIIGGFGGEISGGSYNFIGGGYESIISGSGLLTATGNTILGSYQCEIPSGIEYTSIIAHKNFTDVLDDYTLYTKNIHISNNLQVCGSITAQEFHTTYNSSSVIYSSGSTKFGDTNDDTHKFTGSLTIVHTGSSNVGLFLTGSDFRVDGDISASGNLTVQGDISSSGQGSLYGQNLHLQEDIHLTSTAGTISWGDDEIVNINAVNQGDDGGLITFRTGSATAMLFNTHTKKAQIGTPLSLTPPSELTVEGDISASGDLHIVNSASIGTTVTSSAALTVSGSISASGDIIIGGTVGSNIVFDPDYVHKRSISNSYFNMGFQSGSTYLMSLSGSDGKGFMQVGGGNFNIIPKTLTVTGDISASGDLYFDDTVTINKSTYVSGDISASGVVYASAFSTATGSDISVNNFTSSGNITSSLLQTSSFGRVNAAGNLYVGHDNDRDDSGFISASNYRAQSAYYSMGGYYRGPLTDTDTYITVGLAADQIDFYAGNERMLRLTEAVSGDIVTVGDAGDIDFKVQAAGNNPPLFVQGSDGMVGVGGNSTPTHPLTVGGDISASGDVYLEDGKKLRWTHDGVDTTSAIWFNDTADLMVIDASNLLRVNADTHVNFDTPKVGIGEVYETLSPPLDGLTVEGSITASGNLHIVNSASIGRTHTGSSALTVEGSISASGDVDANWFIGRRFYSGDIVAITASADDTLNIGNDSGVEYIKYGKDIDTSHIFTGEVSASEGLFIEQSASFGTRDTTTYMSGSQKGMFSVDYGSGQQISGSLTTLGDGYGDIVRIGAEDSTHSGMIVMLSNINLTGTTQGQWLRADADGGSLSSSLLGVNLGDTPENDGILLRGFAKVNGNGLMASGQRVYVSTTGGYITASAPSATGNIVRIIGYCLSGSATAGSENHSPIIYFNPDNTWVEIA